MAVRGSDERTLVDSFAGPGLSAVVAIDGMRVAPTSGTPQSPFGLNTSGVVIAPNFVLTSASGLFLSTGTVAAGRITPGSEVDTVGARISTPIPQGQVNFTASGVSYPDGYDETGTHGHDIALIQSTGDIAATPIAMVVFLDPSDAVGLTVSTAGFPGRITDGSGSVNAGVEDLNFRTAEERASDGVTYTEAILGYQATGTLTWVNALGNMEYSDSIDTEAGQSGSGIWTFLDLGEEDLTPALVGVHTGRPRGEANGGHMITEGEYRSIADQISGSDAVPMSILMGTSEREGPTQPGSQFAYARSGEDTMQGTALAEHIRGLGNDDMIEGRGDDDLIDGGSGVDRAGYQGPVSDYTITFDPDTDTDAPQVQIAHSGGNGADGTDTLRDVEFAVFGYSDAQTRGETGFGVDDDGAVLFVPLVADTDDPTKLQDGPEISSSRALVDVEGGEVGTFTATLPSFTFDGDIDFTLNFAIETTLLYNFVYIVDTSGSMRGERLEQTKAALEALTNSLIASGVADRSNFALVDFDDSARLVPDLDADGVIAAVDALVADGPTVFGPPLAEAEAWFETLPNVSSATNIAFFLSDGEGSGASDALQLVNEDVDPAEVDVRAFAIGSGAGLEDLSIIASGDAVQLSSALDLIDAFETSGFDRSKVDRVEVRFDGELLETIEQDDLTDTTLGLSFEGTIGNIPVELGRSSQVRFEVFFNDGTPSQVIETTLGDGQSELRQTSADGSEEIVSLSVLQEAYTVQGPAEQVTGNSIANIFTVGEGRHQILAAGGNDLFLMNGGIGVFNGGDGIDTVRFAVGQESAGALSRSGNLVTIGSEITLIGVEFVEFVDGRFETDTLTEVPLLSFDAETVTVDEDAGSVTFTARLSSAIENDVTFEFATADDTATAGTDYAASAGQATIAAGVTSVDVTISISEDAEFEPFEAFTVAVSNIEGATLAEGKTETTLTGFIADNDPNPDGPALVGNLFNGTSSDEEQVFFAGSNALHGDSGSDHLVGGFQSDQLDGGEGNDILRGDAGNGFLGGSDRLTGGTGDDLKMGGNGADTFVFNPNDGSDIIAAYDPAAVLFDPVTGFSAPPTGADFQIGVDKVELAGFATVDAGNVLGFVSDGAIGAEFAAEGTTITFFGVAAADLASSDFIIL